VTCTLFGLFDNDQHVSLPLLPGALGRANGTRLSTNLPDLAVLPYSSERQAEAP
jgi:hypothetical protein